MSSPPSPMQDSRRIRRIAKACTNCRRKKAKCSGEQPICRNCLRLSQPCNYQDRAPRTRGSQDGSQHGSENADEQQSRRSDGQLSQRLKMVEGKLDDLISTVHSLLPLLQNQRGSSMLQRPESSISSFDPFQSKNGSRAYQSLQSRLSSFTELPPATVSISLIDLYFSRVHAQPYTFFHEAKFRANFATGQVPTYLVFAILASALRFSHDDYYQSRQQEAIVGYANVSWTHIVKIWFAAESEPDLQICQAVTLLSIIDFTAGRRHPGWIKIGLSIRLAQDLRLMLEPDPELTFIDQEERRRVFWSIYILDKLCSCGRARPAALLDSLCHLQLPGYENDFREGVQRSTPTLKQALSSLESHGERPSSAALIVLVATSMGKCAQHMIHEHTKTEGGLPPWDSKSDFAMIHSTLLQLETQFQIGSSIQEALLAQECSSMGGYDMQVVGPILFSYAIFYTAQCLLNHPFLLYQQSKSRGTKPPASFLSRALQSGRENASMLSKLLADADALGCSIQYSFVGYSTTVCAGINIMYLNDRNAEIRKEAQQCLERARNFLRQYAEIWKNGNSMMVILDRLASKPLLILEVVTANPPLELLDPEEIATLWATVDYTTMIQEPASARTTASRVSSPNWDYMFDFNMNQSLSSSMNPLPTGSGLDMRTPDRNYQYNDMMGSGVSPFSAMFQDDTMQFRS